jgi:hypothetical protein
LDDGEKCRSRPGGAYAPIPGDDQHQGDEDLVRQHPIAS